MNDEQLRRAYWVDGTISARQYVLELRVLAANLATSIKAGNRARGYHYAKAANGPHVAPPKNDPPTEDDGPWNDPAF